MSNSGNGGAKLGLLAPDERPAVEVANVDGSSRVVLVCDHASNLVPRRLANLGVDPLVLASHIGWDPGAADVARRLSTHLDAPLVLSGYSRLVIDCNRPPGTPQSVPELSAGIPIPGNRGLSREATEMRIAALFQPYHDMIERVLDSRGRSPPLLLSIHSFTPVLKGSSRPWHVGVSSRRDRRFAELLIAALGRTGECTVGDNQPYPIEDAIDYTIPQHGERRRIPSVMIEIRQDEVGTSQGAAAWAGRLAEAYRLVEAEALGPWGSARGACSTCGDA